MARILVTGGAGYIGSHTVRLLAREGHHVVVLDDLSNGHANALDRDVPLVVASINDERRVHLLFESFAPEAVIHFAGAIEPSLSATDPKRFYRVNVGGMISLCDQLTLHNVPVVFSSSCAVYGNAALQPVAETVDRQPESLYGETKMTGENILSDYNRAYGLRSVALRYFNAAGADPSGNNGADHRLPVHIFTSACRVALGFEEELSIFGDDYDTPDGTCRRDYVHVIDLANAHLLAVNALLGGLPTRTFNVGTGAPHSVREVIEAVERASGRPIQSKVAPRRAGDPASIWANADKIKQELGWRATLSDLDSIASTAWKWHVGNPKGFTPLLTRSISERQFGGPPAMDIAS